MAKTCYLETGSGDPVLLIHGVAIAGGADDWRPALEHLGTGYRFIAPDMGDPASHRVIPAPNLDAFPYMVDFIREVSRCHGHPQQPRHRRNDEAAGSRGPVRLRARTASRN